MSQQESHVSLIFIQAPELALAGAGAFTGEIFLILKQPKCLNLLAKISKYGVKSFVNGGKVKVFWLQRKKVKSFCFAGNNTMMGLGALAAADKFDHMDDKEVNIG